MPAIYCPRPPVLDALYFTIIYLLVGVGVLVTPVGKLALAVIQRPDVSGEASGRLSR